MSEQSSSNSWIVYAIAALVVPTGMMVFDGSLGSALSKDGTFGVVSGLSGLLGAAATIIAGYMALKGIREQIRADITERRRRDEQTSQAIRNVLVEQLELLSQLWRAVDYAMRFRDDPEALADAATAAFVVADMMESSRVGDRPVTEELTEIGKELPALERAKLTGVILGLRWIEFFHQQQKNREDAMAVDNWNRCQIMRTYLSHLAKFVDKYDPALNYVFAGRTRTPVNHDGLAVVARDFLDVREAGRIVPRP
jgi:hypothetical protein